MIGLGVTVSLIAKSEQGTGVSSPGLGVWRLDWEIGLVGSWQRNAAMTSLEVIDARCTKKTATASMSGGNGRISTTRRTAATAL